MPYHLSEADHLRLYQIRYSLRLLENLCSSAPDGIPFVAEEWGCHFSLLDALLSQVLDSVQEASRRK